MKIEGVDGKKVMHIDTSCKLYEKRNTGIAYKIIGSNIHKGIVITKKMKKGLIKEFGIKDLAMIYSIAIYYLIKEDLGLFDMLVICGDEKFCRVKECLDILFKEDLNYLKKEIISISDLRILTGNKKINSYADKISSSYRKRGIKSLGRRQEGITLNTLRINLKMIIDKIKEIKKCSGE